ncbi:hypothetical protein L1987_34043 [Smallanthus sonchifolius]|uniref:Uncharacterized protein n=1 Tax=Smallanthus sonchifolius TaxID=185202 RepID=A0ACB9HSJ1_9ASTR|nr:hypothetical protein L1987_34043 [Smallanthus sonchifolius]
MSIRDRLNLRLIRLVKLVVLWKAMSASVSSTCLLPSKDSMISIFYRSDWSSDCRRIYYNYVFVKSDFWFSLFWL